jgi:hypothetical protein
MTGVEERFILAQKVDPVIFEFARIAPGRSTALDDLFATFETADQHVEFVDKDGFMSGKLATHFGGHSMSRFPKATAWISERMF